MNLLGLLGVVEQEEPLSILCGADSQFHALRAVNHLCIRMRNPCPFQESSSQRFGKAGARVPCTTALRIDFFAQCGLPFEPAAVIPGQDLAAVGLQRFLESSGSIGRSVP